MSRVGGNTQEGTCAFPRRHHRGGGWRSGAVSPAYNSTTATATEASLPGRSGEGDRGRQPFRKQSPGGHRTPRARDAGLAMGGVLRAPRPATSAERALLRLPLKAEGPRPVTKDTSLLFNVRTFFPEDRGLKTCFLETGLFDKHSTEP